MLSIAHQNVITTQPRNCMDAAEKEDAFSSSPPIVSAMAHGKMFSPSFFIKCLISIKQEKLLALEWVSHTLDSREPLINCTYGGLVQLHDVCICFAKTIYFTRIPLRHLQNRRAPVRNALLHGNTFLDLAVLAELWADLFDWRFQLIVSSTPFSF